MSEKSNIQWTDGTHNFWRGCTKISPGCQQCYAESLVTTRLNGEWGKGKPRVMSKDFDAPLRWNKKPWACICGNFYANCQAGVPICPDCGVECHRRRVFSLSLGDIGDPEVPFQWFNDAMVVVEKSKDIIFQLLTKRPDEFAKRWEKVCRHWMRQEFSLPENVWLGVSCENQEMADKRIPELLQIPAKVHFISAEPLLGPIDFHYSAFNGAYSLSGMAGLDWVIVGGESGPKARPCNVEWIRSIVRQCRIAECPVFVKQLRSNPVLDPGKLEDVDMKWNPITKLGRVGNEHTLAPVLKDKKGGDMNEWPEDLRIRQFPNLKKKYDEIQT